MSNTHEEKYIILTMIYRQEDDIWTAECKELGTSTFGDTFEEVSIHLREAVELHLNTLEDVGECETFLKENNIKIYKNRPRRIKTEIYAEPDSFLARNIHPIHAYC